ncbi:MAG: hypothetical protein Q7J10_07650 [Methanosarcinaceae archaeon]|nr:hypothetical protein [Methanosarcinaceae archaeon]
MKGAGDDVEHDLNRLLASKGGKEVRVKIKDIETKLQQTEIKSFENHFERSEYHDKLVDICISAFGPESKCYNDLGYAFISSEPLVELGVKSFDVLIYNEKTKHAIFVECKSSANSNRGRYISDAYEAKTKVIENQTYLEDMLGDKIETMEFVICVPSHKTDGIVRELERQESEGEIDVNSNDLLLIWQVNLFEGEVLQLFTRINSRDQQYKSQHNDQNLTKMLGNDGYEVRSEVLTKFYPSSHPLTIGSKIVTEIITKNMRESTQINGFSKENVEQFCKSSRNLAHYASNKLGKNIVDHFIGECEKFGLIEKVEEKEDLFKLNLEGKHLSTILNNYKKEYKNEFVARKVKQKAAKQVVEEYHKKYPDLSNYVDSL